MHTDTAAPALRFTRTETGLRAVVGDRGYTTYRLAFGSYRLRVWTLVTIDGDAFLGDIVDEWTTDRLSDARAIAAEYAALVQDPALRRRYLNLLTDAIDRAGSR